MNDNTFKEDTKNIKHNPEQAIKNAKNIITDKEEMELENSTNSS